MNNELIVLLVDDDEDDLVILQDVISTLIPSVRFETAKNGSDALHALDKLTRLPHLVFLDVNMPRMDGKECLTRIRNNPKLTDLPIVMYSTAFDPDFLKRESSKLMFMKKQTSMDVMKQEIKAVLERFLINSQ